MTGGPGDTVMWAGLIMATILSGAAGEGGAVFPSRCLYAPGHFGNSYEVLGAREIREVLAEAQHWGFNRYGDWFDTVDCADPFSDPHYNMGRALWDRKKANFHWAQKFSIQWRRKNKQRERTHSQTIIHSKPNLFSRDRLKRDHCQAISE